MKKTGITIKQLNPTLYNSGKLVVYNTGKNLEIYCDSAEYHSDIVDKNSLNPNRVLGGSRYSIAENVLITGDSSDYGRIPQKLADTIGTEIKSYLSKHGINTGSIGVCIGVRPFKKSDLCSEKWTDAGLERLLDD